MPHHCVSAVGQSVRAPIAFGPAQLLQGIALANFCVSLRLAVNLPLRSANTTVLPLAIDRNNIGLPWTPAPRTPSAGASECGCCLWAETTNDQRYLPPVARPCTPRGRGCYRCIALSCALAIASSAPSKTPTRSACASKLFPPPSIAAFLGGLRSPAVATTTITGGAEPSFAFP